ncbi:uncharacterized protein LOC128390272 isoform X2 [Panonychus citri]|nr:uncharacterized protein LOC128390272 isoform X2 [Panonychus citri]
MIKLIILIVLLTPKEIKSNDEYMQSSDSYMSQQSCSCPPLKPIIKYIAVEVPKIVQVPSPAPPPIPMPPQPMKPRTKFIAIQEIQVPSPASGPMSGWGGQR